MSARPVDVLAAWDAVMRPDGLSFPSKQQMAGLHAARAAVAELIEAADDVVQTGGDSQHALTDLRTALARCGASR